MCCLSRYLLVPFWLRFSETHPLFLNDNYRLITTWKDDKIPNQQFSFQITCLKLLFLENLVPITNMQLPIQFLFSTISLMKGYIRVFTNGINSALRTRAEEADSLHTISSFLKLNLADIFLRVTWKMTFTNL